MRRNVIALLLVMSAGVEAQAQIGTVHFRTSCAPSTAPDFDRGVALLHSFEFGSAVAAFNTVLRTDSSCAMAWWGIALSRWSNPMVNANRSPAALQSGLDAAVSASVLAANATERERAYASAVGELYADFEHADQRSRVTAYERAMDALVRREPADTEAMIFHAIALVAAAQPTDKTYANQLRAGAILESLWVKKPDHPGLPHYISHAYDVPALADKAAAAAERYSHIAPSAAHALHMPSHTFTRVGNWDESIAANKRSVTLAMKADIIGEALHASDYLEYAYLQTRRVKEAKLIVDSLPIYSIKFDALSVPGAAPPSAAIFALAAIPARFALERQEWREAAALTPRPSAFPYADAMTWYARALGAAHFGGLTAARAAADTLDVLRVKLINQHEDYWAEQVGIQTATVRAWIAFGENNRPDALARMRAAAAREDATDKSAVTPGPLAPAREQLGDMLLAMGVPVAALAEYRQTLKHEPNRYRTLEGARRAAEKAGDRKTAAQFAAEIKKLEQH